MLAPSRSVVRRDVALVPQWRELFSNFTVEETLLAATSAAARRDPKPLVIVYDLFIALK